LDIPASGAFSWPRPTNIAIFFCWRANKGCSCFAKLSGGQKVPPAVGGGVGVGVGH